MSLCSCCFTWRCITHSLTHSLTTSLTISLTHYITHSLTHAHISLPPSHPLRSHVCALRGPLFDCAFIWFCLLLLAGAMIACLHCSVGMRFAFQSPCLQASTSPAKGCTMLKWSFFRLLAAEGNEVSAFAQRQPSTTSRHSGTKRFDSSESNTRSTLQDGVGADLGTRAYSLLHTHTHTHTHTLTHAHTRSHTLTHAHTNTHTHKHTHARTHTHALTHARTHARTRSPLSLSTSRPLDLSTSLCLSGWLCLS